MTDREKNAAEVRQAWTNLKVMFAATLIYYGYRVLGATKAHAWDRARLDATKAIMDKAVELTGVRHPLLVKPGFEQATFEGGPKDRTIFEVSPTTEEVHVPATGPIVLNAHTPQPPEDRVHVYLRTSRMRGHSVVFSYDGFRLC